jgi:hypothetical protein
MRYEASEALATLRGSLVTQAQLSRYVRHHVNAQLYDESGVSPEGTAIYSLSDPRDIREVRYVGQTGQPRRRFLQHLNTARLWLPDEVPWWVQSPKLRPLYHWIRSLYRDEQRLPIMVVSLWTATVADARTAERRRIFECLAQRAGLLNFEQEILGRQYALV